MRPSARRCSTTSQDKVENVVFLTADVHANLVNDARFNTLGGPGVQNSGILDVTTGPIATANYSLEISDAIGSPNGGSAGAERLPQAAAARPASGCSARPPTSSATPRSRSARAALTIDLLDANDQPVLDTGDAAATGAPPCARVVIPKQ